MTEYIVCPHCHNPLSQNKYVKVVRCRDCKHYVKAELLHGWNDFCGLFESVITPDGFCAWAERKEGE